MGKNLKMNGLHDGNFEGFVYLIINYSLPNWVKIGFSKDPEDRIRRLGTAVPTPFVIYRAWATDNMRGAEAICHRLLDSLRAPSGREFFVIKTGVEIQTYECDYSGEVYEVPSWPVDDLADWLENEVQRQGVIFESAFFCE